MQYSSITGESVDNDNPFRYVSVNKGLDFNNVEIDFTSNIEYYYPRYENIQTSSFPIIYFVIDFNGNKIRNFNTKNGNILGASMYTLLKNVKVDGSVSYDLDLIESLTTQSSTSAKTDLYISNLNGIPFVTEGSALDVLFMNFYKNIDLSLKVKFLNNSSFTKIGTIYVISRTKVPSVESELTSTLNENFQNIKTNITYSLENTDIEHLLEFNSIQNAYILNTGETINDCTLDLTVGVNRENNIPTVSKGLSVQTSSNTILRGSGTVNNIYSLVNEGHFAHDISVQKNESELKSISFLNTLNLASDENVWNKGDDGYPSLKLKDMPVIYDGYVKQSELESVYNNVSSNTSKIETLETNVSSNISRIENLETKIEEGENGIVTKELQPNTYYEFGVCDQLTITLASGRTGYLNQYMFEFSCNPFSATALNSIPGVFWQNNEPLIPESGYKYQVSIINNVASYYKVLSSYGIVTYTTTGTSQSVQLIHNQEYANKITLEDGTDVPITGTGVLNYTFADAGEHKVAIKLKKNISSFYECFRDCSGLTSIPDNLFAANTAVTNFSFCFQNCSELTSIPANLFVTNTSATDFTACFRECTGLTNIPENLFVANTAVTDFRSCFQYCSGLTGSIPDNLFSNNTAVTDFNGCFYNCTGLTSIPANLFVTNTSATDFSYCFYRCSGLTGSIPENLFSTNTAVTNFSHCFNACTGLTGNCPVDNDGTPIYNRSGEGKPGYSIVTSSGGCFRTCTGLTDYSSIPSGWK